MKFPKVTEPIQTPHGRWYGDACGTAFAMELIGERWSLMIVRELMLGPRRFSDLRASLPGLSAKVLTERLTSLEAVGALRREELPPPAAAVKVYALTQWGYSAEPAIQELGRWAAQHSGHDPTLPLSPVSLMLSFRTMFDAGRAGDLRVTVGFDIAGEQFLVDVADGKLVARRGDASEGEAVFRAPAAPVIAALTYADVPPGELKAGAGLVIEGDEALAQRYVDIFELPPKIA